MSSAINTNGIDVNYPIPGQNNNSQGFRNNFTAIKTNLDSAGNEISDLQNKAVLKTALANSVLNNDMANTLISNASTLGFRATTYNLGNALSGTIVVDCSLGDVQYGNVAGNITLQFGSWAPTGTQSRVQLQLGRANANSNVSVAFPTEAVIDNNHGFVLLENFSTPNSVPTISFPYNVTQLNFSITSNDCGNSLFIEPTNRPFEATQIQTRTPPSTGQLGDVVGTVCIDTGTSQLVVTNVSSVITLSGVQITGTAGQFSCTATTLPLVVGQALTISGTFGGTGSITGYSNPTTYYIIATNGSTTFTLSTTSGPFALPVVTTAGTPTGLTYVVDADLFTTSNTATLYTGLPVTFTGTSLEANIVVGNTYYVRNVVSSTRFTLSSTVSGANIGIASNASGTTMFLNPVQYMYVAVQNYNASTANLSIESTTSPNLLNVTSNAIAANVKVNQPLIFTGNNTNLANIGVIPDTVYYVKTITGGSSNVMSVSQTRNNGIAGPEYQGITSVSSPANVDFTAYNGSDIFRRTPLQPF